MKRIRIFIAMLMSVMMSNAAFACDVCKKQQPKILRGVTHGAGPQSAWDYVFVICTVIIAVISLFFAIRWMWHPGEKQPEHIKRTVLNFD